MRHVRRRRGYPTKAGQTVRNPKPYRKCPTCKEYHPPASSYGHIRARVGQYECLFSDTDYPATHIICKDGTLVMLSRILERSGAGFFTTRHSFTSASAVNPRESPSTGSSRSGTSSDEAVVIPLDAPSRECSPLDDSDDDDDAMGEGHMDQLLSRSPSPITTIRLSHVRVKIMRTTLHFMFLGRFLPRTFEEPDAFLELLTLSDFLIYPGS